MLNAPNRYRIIICSGKTLGFIRSSLQDLDMINLDFRECASDLGYVLKHNSVEPDLKSFKLKYLDYIKTMPIEIQREADFILTEQIDLVISDISPVPIASAKLRNVKSLGISNFTWYTAYQQLVDREFLKPLSDVYSQMDYFVHLSGSEEPRWGSETLFKSGFFCRAPNRKEINRIANQLNPQQTKLIVYFALGMSIQAGNLDSIKMFQDDSYLFVVSSNMNISGKNVHCIPSSYTESQNYVAAADVIISKPGWGTVGEAIIFNKPLILLNRGLMIEDQNTIMELISRHSYQLASWNELIELDIKRIFRSMDSEQKPQRILQNEMNLQKIVRFIVEKV